jgi:hypothetical protein
MMESVRRGCTASSRRRAGPDDIAGPEDDVLVPVEPDDWEDDIGAMTESIGPGRHTLQVDNTLFKKTIEFVAGVNDHIAFKTANLAGWGTYSAWALLIGFLGAGPFYLMLERDETAGPKDGTA